MTRTKMICLSIGLAGLMAVGLTALPPSSAQDKTATGPAAGGGGAGGGGGGPPPGGSGSGPPMGGMALGGGMPGGTTAGPSAAWEYKYVVRKTTRLEDFQKALSGHATDGWEYVGTEALTVPGDTNPGPVLVFKRPAGFARGGMGFGRAGMGGMGGGSMGPGMMGGGPPGMGMPGMGGPGPGGGTGGGGFGGAAGGPGVGGGGGFGGGRGLNNLDKKTEEKKRVSPKAGELRVFTLKHAKADSLAKTLQELFGDDARIVAEQQTNTLLVQSDEKTFETIATLLDRLDSPPAAKR